MISLKRATCREIDLFPLFLLRCFDVEIQFLFKR